ncbi:MAG: hypothetical protein LBP98_05390 [Tannerella sp.]|nr:hypothetical protein [Tannerella sp.]
MQRTKRRYPEAREARHTPIVRTTASKRVADHRIRSGGAGTLHALRRNDDIHLLSAIKS